MPRTIYRIDCITSVRKGRRWVRSEAVIADGITSYSEAQALRGRAAAANPDALVVITGRAG